MVVHRTASVNNKRPAQELNLFPTDDLDADDDPNAVTAPAAKVQKTGAIWFWGLVVAFWWSGLV